MKRRWIALSIAMACQVQIAYGQEIGPKIILGQTTGHLNDKGDVARNFNEGARIYFTKINMAGGIYGRKIDFVSFNDGNNPELASRNIEELITKHKVFAFFGNGYASNSRESRKRYASAGIPSFAPLSGSEELRYPLDKFTFNIKAGYKEEAEKLVSMLKATKAQTVHVVYFKSSEETSALEHIQRAFSKNAMNPAKVLLLQGNSDPISEIVREKPDAVIVLAPVASSAGIIKKLKSEVYNGQIWVPSLVGPSELSASLGTDSRGVGFSHVVPYPFTYTTPVSHELAAELKDNTSFSALEGYIAAKVFCEGLRRVGNKLTRENFLKVLESGAFDAGGYTVRFGINDHEGSKFVDTAVMTRSTKMIH